MSQKISPSTGQRFDLALVCKAWNIPRANVYRHRHPVLKPANRPGPIGLHSDDELLQAIKKDLASSPFHGEGHRKVWARLRFAGIRTSRRRVLRIMGENSLLAPHRKGPSKGPRNHDGTITTENVNTMWGTDMTGTFTLSDGQVAVFIAVDHCNSECIGIHAAKRGTRFEALEPIRQGVREHFGGFDKEIAIGLSLRHDNGSQYVSHHFQEEIRFLGIESSPSFVRAPEGNGCSERFIRTLKENLLWVKTFKTLEDLQDALHEFRKTYNQKWLIQRHKYKSPAQIRQELSGELKLAA